jgi:hypothetical protein
MHETVSKIRWNKNVIFVSAFLYVVMMLFVVNEDGWGTSEPFPNHLKLFPKNCSSTEVVVHFKNKNKF